MRRAILLLATTTVALLLASRVALAVNKVGTDGPDLVRGTNGSDNLVGLDGNDRLFSLAGKDNLQGGPGKDIVFLRIGANPAAKGGESGKGGVLRSSDPSFSVLIHRAVE